jgi:DNA invertase Pin-like site-specific DNA recombinase
MRPELEQTPIQRAAIKDVRAAAKAEGARGRLKEEVVKAHRDGMPVAEIARQAALTRATIYTWIKEKS